MKNKEQPEQQPDLLKAINQGDIVFTPSGVGTVIGVAVSIADTLADHTPDQVHSRIEDSFDVEAARRMNHCLAEDKQIRFNPVIELHPVHGGGARTFKYHDVLCLNHRPADHGKPESDPIPDPAVIIRWAMAEVFTSSKDADWFDAYQHLLNDDIDGGEYPLDLQPCQVYEDYDRACLLRFVDDLIRSVTRLITVTLAP